ncbi:MAG TPA: serine--tRNA ligase [Oligoflexia bacterium]|nr:serine--tRNA ligase [Oligoflexia bacterium]HMP26369.1 serine--tRNA ligase [Oligoflexia bacterium]
MIDLNDLRQNPDKYREGIKKKYSDFNLDYFITLDAGYREKKKEFEALRAEQNTFSKQINTLKGEAKEQGLVRMKEIASKLKDLSSLLDPLEREWRELALKIPNPPSSISPIGKDDTANVERRREGEIPVFKFKPRDHVELGKLHKLFDIERGVKTAGSRSYFLTGVGVTLQRAVLQLALDRLAAKGFVLLDVPQIVRREAMEATGYLPGGEDAAFKLDERDPDKFLIGTAEVSACYFHADEIIDLSKGPLKYAGVSPCYRREAGTYGRDTHGLYRVHQFYKVEQVVFCKADPDESASLHVEILGNAEELLRLLELPYRVVDNSTGDMGQGQFYKNDIETWMPSRGAYGETHSCSTFHEFQARRLNVRYKDNKETARFCHTLNNTCVASPRILIPLLEVHQREDGSIYIPPALRGYLGGLEELRA